LTERAEGTYKWIKDPFPYGIQTSQDRTFQIVAGPGENQITCVDAFGYPQKFDMIIDVDPATGIATS